MIAKAISKGAYGGNMIYTYIGSKAKMAEQGPTSSDLLQTEPFHSVSFLISTHPS